MQENSINGLRSKIDEIDEVLIKKLDERFALSKQIQKLKNSPLKYVPLREKEILSKCRGHILDIYIQLLALSRQIESSADFYYFVTGESVFEDELLKNAQKFFGDINDFEKIDDIKTFINRNAARIDGINQTAEKNVKNETAGGGKDCFLIFSDSGNLCALAEQENKILYKLSEYQISSKTLFFVYSNIKSEGEPVSILLHY
ncbi:MAG: chorismate mutase [Candidatus Wallbacteria bacterium]